MIDCKDHITTCITCIFTSLGCLKKVAPPQKKIFFLLFLKVHRCLYGDAPSYLADLITPSATATVRPGLRSAASSSVAVPRTIVCRRSETGPSLLLAHVHGTNFHHRFVAFTLLILLNVNLRHFYTMTLLIYIVKRPYCVSALTSP